MVPPRTNNTPIKTNEKKTINSGTNNATTANAAVIKKMYKDLGVKANTNQANNLKYINKNILRGQNGAKRAADESLENTSASNNWQKPRKIQKASTAAQQTRPQVITQNRFTPISTNNSEIIDDDEKNMQIEEDNEESEPTAISETKEKENQMGKPPPIFTCETNVKDLINVLNCIEEINNSFLIKPNSVDCATIKTFNLEKFNIIKNILKEKKIKFYTYTSKHMKNKSLVLKNLYGDFSDQEIIAELEKKSNQKLDIIKVKKLNKIIDLNRPISYLLIFKNTTEPNILKSIKYIFSQAIKWEEQRKKVIYQCHKCQMTGHSSYNCNLDYKCVRCTDTHDPGACPQKQNNNNVPKCVNCGLTGHPASYRGCTYFKFVHSIEKNKKEIIKNNRNRRINKIYNKVTPNRTFSQAFTGNNDYTQYSQGPTLKNNPNFESNTNNENSIKDLLNQMKTDILNALNPQFQSINQQLQSNSQKIEILANEIGIQWK